MGRNNISNDIMIITSNPIKIIREALTRTETGISEYLVARNSTITAIENIVQLLHDIPLQRRYDPKRSYSYMSFMEWVNMNSKLLPLSVNAKETDSATRIIFLTDILIYIVNNFDILVEMELIYRDNCNEDIKIPGDYDIIHGNYIQKMVVFQYMIETVREISIGFVCKNSSLTEYYYDIMKLISLEKGVNTKYNKKLKYISTFKTQLSIIQDSQKVTFLGFRMEDDILVNNICKLAYIIVTESDIIKHTSPVITGLVLDDKQKIITAVRELGKDIHKYMERHPDSELSTPFYMYQKIHVVPKLRLLTEYKHDIDFQMGYDAIRYFAFVANSADIYGIMKRMGG